MDRRSLARILQGDDGILLVDLEPDQRDGILGHGPRFRNDHGDRIADAGNPPIGQQGQRRGQRGEEEGRHRDRNGAEVGLRVDRVDSRQGAGRFQVQRHDPPSCYGRAEKGAVQQARHAHVIDELTAPGEQARVFLAGDAPADEARCAGADHAHETGSSTSAVSWRMARRMP
jgi:hypothetical protein